MSLTFVFCLLSHVGPTGRPNLTENFLREYFSGRPYFQINLLGSLILINESFGLNSVLPSEKDKRLLYR